MISLSKKTIKNERVTLDGLFMMLLVLFIITALIHESLHVIFDWIFLGTSSQLVFFEGGHVMATVPSHYVLPRDIVARMVISFIINIIPSSIQAVMIKKLLEKSQQNVCVGMMGTIIIFIVVGWYDVLNFLIDMGVMSWL